MTTPAELLPQLTAIIQEFKDASDTEDAFVFEQKKLSKKPLKYLQSIIDDPDETDDTKAIATLLIAHEHAFLEIYYGRRLMENSFLQSLEEIKQALESLIKNER